MNVATPLTNCTLGQSVPLINVQKTEERRSKLYFVRPKRAVAANGAYQLPTLDFYWPKMLWFSKREHFCPFPATQCCLGLRLEQLDAVRLNHPTLQMAFID